MRKKVKQPFIYGKYLVEYRDTPTSPLRILKERIDTFEEAQKFREQLLISGSTDPVIRKVG
jgi:hypothetical protein